MARPAKHNWEEIHNYYKAGMTQAELCKKFNLSKSTLSERIKNEKWVVSEQVTERLNGVISAVNAVSELSVGEQRAVTEIIDETIKRNNAIDTVAKKALLKIGKLIDNAETLKDMKDGADAIGKVKDILLPETKKPDNAVNVTVNTTQIAQAKTAEEASKVYMDLIGR